MLCFNQTPAIADNNSFFIPAPVVDSCGEIVDNYLDAVGEFNSVLQAMLLLGNQSNVSIVLDAGINEINNNNITFNAMQAYEGAVAEELKKYPDPALNEGMSQLKSQLSSLHTRVDQWKSKSTGCRKKYACDLGEPGFCTEKH
jgi:hypothetical protein